jgi:hypothetical protein
MKKGGVILGLPGPRFISKPLGIVLNFIGGVVIGKWLFGYRDSYSEYYKPKSAQTPDTGG